MSKALILVASIIIVAGSSALFSKKMNRKFVGMICEILGLLVLSNSIGNQLGFYSGKEMIVYQFVPFVMFMVLLIGICRKNQIKEMADLCGLQHRMPYTYVLLVLEGLFVVGIPGTGTFLGYLLCANGLLSDSASYGCFVYIGLFAMVLGIVLLGIQIFDLFRFMFTLKEKKEWVMIKKPLLMFMAIVMVGLMVISFWQVPLLRVIEVLYKKFGA